MNLLPIYLFDRKVPSSVIGLYTGILGQSLSILGSFLAGLWLKKTNKNHSTHKWLNYILFVRVVPIFLISFLIISSDRNNLDPNKALEDSTLCKHMLNLKILFLVVINVWPFLKIQYYFWYSFNYFFRVF